MQNECYFISIAKNYYCLLLKSERLSLDELCRKRQKKKIGIDSYKKKRSSGAAVWELMSIIFK